MLHFFVTSFRLLWCVSYSTMFSRTTAQFNGLCPGQPWWTSTRRKHHSLTTYLCWHDQYALSLINFLHLLQSVTSLCSCHMVDFCNVHTVPEHNHRWIDVFRSQRRTSAGQSADQWDEWCKPSEGRQRCVWSFVWASWQSQPCSQQL